MKRPYPFHPPLFAVYPALSLYAANVALIDWRDVITPSLLAISGALVIWGLAWLFVRDLPRAAAGASAVILGFFTYDVLSKSWGTLFYGEIVGHHARAPIWLWLILVTALAVLLAWKSGATPKITTFLNFVGSVLLVLAIGTIATSHWGIRNEIAQRASDTPSPIRQSNRRPDVIYIILDGYGRTDVFERLYGFSDANFIHAMESNGFYVAGEARANYCQTELSLASSLNMSPVQEFIDPKGDMIRARAVLDERIDDSKVARAFKARGYRYIAITTGFPALRFDSADVRIERDSGATLYWNALLEKTPIPPNREALGSQFAQRRKFLNAGFAALQDLARPSATPRFVVMHILAPHPPFVFGSSGEEIRPAGSFGFWDGSHYNEMAGTDEQYRAGYRGQAQHIARLLLEALKAFSEKGPEGPIIIVQGDHGPKADLDQESLEKTDVNEVFPILAAYRVPDDVRAKLYRGISPINTFRIVLSTLFGGDLPNLPDRSYYSTWEKPIGLTDVTARLAPRSAELQEKAPARRTGATGPN